MLMLRFIEWISETLFWIRIFLSPFVGFSIIAFIVHQSDNSLLPISVFLVIAGIISGIAFAEWARKKYGCSTYISGLISPIKEKDKTEE